MTTTRPTSGPDSPAPSPPQRRESRLARLGRTMHDRRGRVVLAWIGVLVLLGALAGAIGSGFRAEFEAPGESARGFEILEEQFEGLGAGYSGALVFRAEQGVESPQVTDEMSAYFQQVGELPDVTVISPYSDQARNQISTEGPSAGQIAYAQLEVPRDYDVEQAGELADEMRELAPDVPGVEIEIGGELFAEQEPPESEILGLAFAIVILILAFGSVLAMGLPIGTALAGIGVGSMATFLISNVVTMPEFTSTIAIMIGLGVGIDYALFIVTRYREELHRGLDFSDATAKAIDTAGRAVLFAGVTVVISLLGLFLMGIEFVQGLGIGAASVVAVTMVASVTLLPALLGFAAHRVEVTRWRGLIAAGLVAVALVGIGIGIDLLLVALPLAAVVLVAGFFVGALEKELPPRTPKPIERTVAYRWSRFVQAHPVSMVMLGLATLVVLALPVFGLRLGFSDEGNYPEDTTTRQAYDLLSEGFGPGFNGPLTVVTELPGQPDQQQLLAVSEAIGADEGVAVVNGPIPNDPEDPTAALWQVIPTTAPQAEETDQLVDRLRAEVLPEAFAGTDTAPAVTGTTAVTVDFSDYLGDRLPLFFGVVLALSFLLLMAVFRSLLVPLKAVIVNLLSIGAAYGVAVALFQWGWLGDLTGLEPAPIEPFVPMMLFAIVFGLSMDYEVFLLSRVKEEYDLTGDNARAVADGLASTARVITAAAAIMVFVFGSFLLEDNRVVKLMGLGLATAIFLDASIVRMLLVPAAMELFGDGNWWLPRWLDRILPRIHVEGSYHEELEEELEEHEVGREEREPARV